MNYTSPRFINTVWHLDWWPPSDNEREMV
jgi:hypothetical protein